VTTVIARTMMRVVVPVVILMSLYLLLRGHDEPGGGFMAALAAGAAIVLRRFVDPERRPASGVFLYWLAAGLALAVVVGLVGIVLAGSFLGPRVWYLPVPLLGEVKVTLSLLFDLGVFLTVVAVVRAIIDEMGASR
jgi:multisubunit Na+/H+ antiporter MnhB subunit